MSDAVFSLKLAASDLYFREKGTMTLKLTNNVTNKSYSLEVSSTINASYAYADVILPKMDDGEYDYQLIADDKIISSGLCQIGEVKHEAKEYNNEVKYKQYNG